MTQYPGFSSYVIPNSRRRLSAWEHLKSSSRSQEQAHWTINFKAECFSPKAWLTLSVSKTLGRDRQHRYGNWKLGVVASARLTLTKLGTLDRWPSRCHASPHTSAAAAGLALSQSAALAGALGNRPWRLGIPCLFDILARELEQKRHVDDRAAGVARL